MPAITLSLPRRQKTIAKSRKHNKKSDRPKKPVTFFLLECRRGKPCAFFGKYTKKAGAHEESGLRVCVLFQRGRSDDAGVVSELGNTDRGLARRVTSELFFRNPEQKIGGKKVFFFVADSAAD